MHSMYAAGCDPLASGPKPSGPPLPVGTYPGVLRLLCPLLAFFGRDLRVAPVLVSHCHAGAVLVNNEHLLSEASSM